ncbi:MAG: phosphopentomutase [Lachnospiraceae bacterium]
MKRVFLIVLDSVGIGAMPDADKYHDEGSHTVLATAKSKYFHLPNLKQLGFFNIEGNRIVEGEGQPKASYGRMTEKSNGKDTTIGHWEIAGICSKEPLPVFPNGFPKDLIDKLEKETGRKIICNKPYSGTEVIKDYGEEQVKTGALIVYTSADSVLQIAAHEDIVSLEELYHVCEIARKLCVGEYGVGRIIARPFKGEKGEYVRTSNRHDYSLNPPKRTMLNELKTEGYAVIAVGKIHDIFAGDGITESIRTKNNLEGIQEIIRLTKKDFNGLCFVNLVDFDMLYGHRNDIDGYAKALAEFDKKVPEILSNLNKDDLLIITADHGCDPSTPSTDHSREYTPLIIYGQSIKEGVDLETRESFSDIAATILEYFGLELRTEGKSMLDKLYR